MGMSGLVGKLMGLVTERCRIAGETLHELISLKIMMIISVVVVVIVVVVVVVVVVDKIIVCTNLVSRRLPPHLGCF